MSALNLNIAFYQVIQLNVLQMVNITVDECPMQLISWHLHNNRLELDWPFCFDCPE